MPGWPPPMSAAAGWRSAGGSGPGPSPGPTSTPSCTARPFYRAPDSTVGPASRVTFVLAAIVRDAHDAGVLALPTDGAALGDAEADAARLAELAMAGVPTVTVARALEAWTQLFGFVSFELFGHFVGVLEDTDSFFERALLDMGAHVGLPSAA